jgi:hypothetical protein
LGLGRALADGPDMGAIRFLPVKEQVALIGAGMRDVDHGDRVGCHDAQHVTRSHAAQRFFQFEHRKRTDQAYRINFDHQGSVDPLRRYVHAVVIGREVTAGARAIRTRGGGS